MKPKVDTIVQFSGLKPGKYEYDYTLDNTFFEEFDNDELREGSVDFRVVLDKKERMLMFTFSFSGIVKSICDRCLGELDVPVEGENTLCVKFSDTETSDNEDVVILPETAYKIDLENNKLCHIQNTDSRRLAQRSAEHTTVWRKPSSPPAAIAALQ